MTRHCGNCKFSDGLACLATKVCGDFYVAWKPRNKSGVASIVQNSDGTVLGPNSKPTNPKDAVGCKKVGLSVIPANVLAETALALTEGALKYGRHNYRGCGVRASIYYDATMRHLMAWWEGEDIDPDSQLSHITKAIAGLTVLRDSMMRENWTDDRPPKTKAGWMLPMNERVLALQEQHKDAAPVHHFEKDQ